jgi:hypothetical protein
MGSEKASARVVAVVALVVVVAIVFFFFMGPSSSDDHRVLLVASDVLAQAGGQAKLTGLLSNKSVAVVPYNYDRVATYAELGGLVKAHLDSAGASRVRSVGIMYHTPNRYNLKCFASDPEKSTVSGSLESFESFRRFVVALRAAYGVEDVDLISCDVVSAETSVLSALDFNGARVNASTNTTGQVKQGPVGDWVLEAGNVNLIGRYFNASITTADIALSSSRFRTNTGPKPSAQNQGGIVGYQGDVSGIERQNQKEQFDAWQAGLSEGAQAYQNKFNDAIGRELSEKNHRRDQAIVEQNKIGRGRYNKYGVFEQWV